MDGHENCGAGGREDGNPPDAIKAQLEIILSSPEFANSGRLSRFLRCLVHWPYVIAAGISAKWRWRGLVFASGLIAAVLADARAETSGMQNHVGSERCSACHAEQAAAWRVSHHSWALRAADETSVLGDFDDAAFEHAGVRTRFTRRNGKPFVESDGPDGGPTLYEVQFAVDANRKDTDII